MQLTNMCTYSRPSNQLEATRSPIIHTYKYKKHRANSTDAQTLISFSPSWLAIIINSISISSMDRWQNRVAVVTGASSGIGSAIVVDLVNAGLIVVGLARRVERVKELQKLVPAERRDKLIPIQCDVGNEASVKAAFDAIEQQLGGIDILINNAGTLQDGRLVDMPISQVQQTVQTNIMGIVMCTQRAFASMKKRNFDGHVVLINSILGHKVFGPTAGSAPQSNIYPPTKYAVTALTEMYRQEFLGLGTRIKITSISPGVVDTEIVPDRVRDAVSDTMLKSEDISQAVLFTLSTPPHMQVHEITIKPVGELL
ncbi:farnesol dehydrogenase-like isoform X1 [Drosophila albomicans]|uniref:Farnesol dehydrogenase-like isoform X1 n=1 Tax=Drosophila albomicans TaxID=7291 RepID=A0A9C6SV92_DROAB|nr:farnesol dehydrogenase-like isoform X1 [Drosophila albomicans]